MSEPAVVEALTGELLACKDRHEFSNPWGGIWPWGKYNCRDYAMAFQSCFAGSHGYIQSMCYHPVSGVAWIREGTHLMNWIGLPNGKKMLLDPQTISQGLSVSKYTEVRGLSSSFTEDMVDGNGCIEVYTSRRVGASECNNHNADHSRCCVISEVDLPYYL